MGGTKEQQQRVHDYYLANREKLLAQRKARYATNRSDLLSRQKEYYKANSEKVKAYQKTYNEDNPEKVAAGLRAWYLKNKEKCLAKNRIWVENNRDKSRASTKKWSSKNIEKCKQLVKDWTKQHPDEVVQYRHNRRAVKDAASGSFTGAEFSDLKTVYGNVCLRCWRSAGLVKLTADHVIPLSKGGSNYISNIQPLCGSCNSTKGTKSTDYRILLCHDT